MIRLGLRAFRAGATKREYEKVAAKGRVGHLNVFFYRGMCAKEDQWVVVRAAG